MSSLFIIGNGFDLAHGIPSKYDEFRKFMVEEYPNVEVTRNEPIELDDFHKVKKGELAASMLINTMDHFANKNWCDFEKALASVDLNDKFIKPKHKPNETMEEDNKLMHEYLMKMNSVITKITGIAIQCWQCLFKSWIAVIQNAIERGEYKPLEDLKSLLQDSSTKVFSFNYTQTVEKLYGNYNVTHIHNVVGDETLIFGHGENEPIPIIQYLPDGREKMGINSWIVDEMIMKFKKDVNAQIDKYQSFFNSLDDSVDKVYSYGFSYQKVDLLYIKLIVDKISPNATWYFSKFECSPNQKKELMKKKRILHKLGFRGKTVSMEA